MKSMSRRGVLLIILGVVTLAATWLGVFSPAPLPQVATAPAPESAPSAPAPPSAATPSSSAETSTSAEPAPTVKTSTVTLRRGDTLLVALRRGGLDRRASTDIADALRASGADLRRLRPRDELEITWTLDGEPISVRWEPSPWLGFAAVATDSGWEVRRAETRPDVGSRRAARSGARSSRRSRPGESAQLVLELVRSSSEFDHRRHRRAIVSALIEKRYAGDDFVDTVSSWWLSTSATAGRHGRA
jgi:hypothetical protein